MANTSGLRAGAGADDRNIRWADRLGEMERHDTGMHGGQAGDHSIQQLVGRVEEIGRHGSAQPEVGNPGEAARCWVR